MKDIVYRNETQKEAIEYTSKLIDWGLSLIISSALNELLTTYGMLKLSKYYQHKVKPRSNEALRLRNAKMKQLKDVVMHKGFSETYWDTVIDVCEDDVNALRQALKTVLDEASIPDSALFSQIETTRILLESARYHFDDIIHECTNKFLSKNADEMKGINLREIFIESDITPIFKEWDAVCSLLYRGHESSVDLNDSRVTEAFNVLASKFAKGEYIEACMNVAKEEYPEFYNAHVKAV